MSVLAFTFACVCVRVCEMVRKKGGAAQILARKTAIIALSSSATACMRVWRAHEDCVRAPGENCVHVRMRLRAYANNCVCVRVRVRFNV